MRRNKRSTQPRDLTVDLIGAPEEQKVRQPISPCCPAKAAKRDPSRRKRTSRNTRRRLDWQVSRTKRARTTSPKTTTGGQDVDEGNREEPGATKLSRGRSDTGPPKGKGGRKCKHGTPIMQTKVNGEVFKAGMTVYVSMEEDGDLDCQLTEEETCYVCGCPPGAKRKGAMLECDGCLKGFHLQCLRPPLKKVPEGDWYCPECLGCLGEYTLTRPAQAGKTAREMYFTGKLELARIEKIWRNSDGVEMFEARWYYKPEQTEVGRQPHHGRREIFLSNHVDLNEVGVIVKPATVLSPAQFRAAANAGDDVYFCEYDYDAGWRRFRRRIDDEEEWSDFEDASEDDANSDLDDQQFNPKNERAPLASTRGRPKSERRSGASRGANVRNAHGSHETLGLGALEIPACVRQAERSPLSKARAALALSSVPRKLPCRDRERAEIRAFVQEAIRAAGTDGNCQGRCLYISGVPGTGKTATVMEVLRELRKEADNNRMSTFQFVEINGLRLPSPQHAYSILYESLAGRYVAPPQAAELLEEHFSARRRQPSSPQDGRKGRDARLSEVTILLVDELDLLVTRKQDVLYNIFDWPTYKNARVAVIGIANTMDLPERLLPRIISRMGLQRLQFSPYTREQIATIAQSRLEGVDCFDKRAVEFTSRKVASVSGDVRRALEICRKAAEIRQLRTQHELENLAKEDRVAKEADPATWKVTIADVDKAIKEMDDGAHVQLIRSITVHERIALVALAVAIRRTGTFQVDMEAVLEEYYKLCDSHEFEPCLGGDGAVIASIWRMAECRLVLAEYGRTDRHQCLSLNVSSDDIAFALRGDVEPAWLARHLQGAGTN